MSRRVGAWLLLTVLTAACAALAWSVGVIIEGTVDDPDRYDYLWQPIDRLVDLRFLVIVVALAVAVVSGRALLRRRRDANAPADNVIAPIVLIGIVIGGGYSVITAPVIGANIGGGLVLVAGPVAVVGLMVLAVVAARGDRSVTPD